MQRPMSLRVSVITANCLILWGAGACGSDDGSNVDADGRNGPGKGGSLNLSGGGRGVGVNPDGSACTADFAGAQLQPVYLAFAFDVSGSMGKLDKPYHDPDLKWRPVVAATRSFFEAPGSAGINASLTFFPAAADKCEASVYATPDVEMTALPSPVFGEALTAIDPLASGAWRGGTPTLAVVEGSVGYVQGLMQREPAATYALVLVTDGYPNGCDDGIPDVANVLADNAASFATYVIGVKNPQGGPDTVSDLNALAVAGQTQGAIFIDTGDPQKTTQDFAAAVDAIRERAISCNAVIPPTPGGRPFDKGQVNVAVQRGADVSRLGYDQACAEPSAWRYDDPDSPTEIVLCAGACQEIQSDPTLALSVEFGCITEYVDPR
jgi:hypothetical protein